MCIRDSGIASLIISAVRQLAVLLPAAFILSKLWGINATWWAFPIAEIVGVSLCIYFIYRIYHRDLKYL